MKESEKKQPSQEEVNKTVSETEMQKKIAQLEKTILELQKASYPGSTGISPEQLQKILETVTHRKEKELDFEAGIDSESIPIEDYDEKGVTFFAPGAGYVTSGDKRNGINIKIPYGKKSIFFEHYNSKTFKQGKYNTIAHVSKYTSHSKKEIEWLRNHSKFNVYFYPSPDGMLNTEVSKSMRIADIMNWLKDLDHPALIARCKENSVEPNEDPAIMRSNLAFKMYQKELINSEETAKRKISETEKEKLLSSKE
jgi:hypothetical protein